MAKQKKKNPNDIAVNKKANFDYEMKEEFVAGLILTGWQVKSLRAGRVSLANNPHIVFDRNGEAWISGMMINPLPQANTHEFRDANASVKLLLNRKEIDRLMGQRDQKGMTIVLNKLFWKKNLIKAKVSLAKGKNVVDKRKTIQEREGKIEAERVMKNAKY